MKRISRAHFLALMITIAAIWASEALAQITAQITGNITIFLFDASEKNVDRQVVIDGKESPRHTGKPFQLSQGSHRITLSGEQDYAPKFQDVEITSDGQSEMVIFSLAAGSSLSKHYDVFFSGFVRSIYSPT